MKLRNGAEKPSGGATRTDATETARVKDVDAPGAAGTAEEEHRKRVPSHEDPHDALVPPRIND